jgi:hypothetical protein
MIMDRNSVTRLTWIVALVVSALLIPYAASLAAQKSAGNDGKAKALRLPNYYAKVASGEQRTQLRAVMKEYAPQIKAKREELQALVAKRDAALDEVLTPEQRQEVAKLRAEATARRKAANSDGPGKGKKAKADPGKAKKAA